MRQILPELIILLSIISPKSVYVSPVKWSYIRRGACHARYGEKFGTSEKRDISMKITFAKIFFEAALIVLAILSIRPAHPHGGGLDATRTARLESVIATAVEADPLKKAVVL